MIRRLLAAVTVLLVAAVLLLAAWPQLFGLEQQFGIAQIVSLRGLAALAAGVGIVALLLIALVSRRTRRLAATLALLLLAFAGVSAAVLATRGMTPAGFQTKAAHDLTVLSWNTFGDAPGAAEIARLAVEQKADIVALPETSEATARAVLDRMGQAGIRMQLLTLSYDRVAKAHTTSLLISTKLGTYRRDDSQGSTKTLPSVLAVPADGSGPTIVAAHPVAPVEGEMSNWRSGLDWLAARCGSTASAGSGTIVAGDFNSTLDHYAGLTAATASGHGDLGTCHDGARARNTAAVGSWPTSLPTSLGAPIDHVMASDGWRFVGFRVIGTEDAAGSDHRPVVAQLRPRS
ncbi:MAG: endonuclease/exonuclease/phosphatase family protein [Actinomycetota bacterium]|nr:endonuclease/exonuclease/phosphatase family protein [Actinomycetota bacterium]